jgi:hypothetical protein
MYAQGVYKIFTVIGGPWPLLAPPPWFRRCRRPRAVKEMGLWEALEDNHYQEEAGHGCSLQNHIS